ncbi:hypothetical protein GQ37_004595 [Janthinobacterium sp. BJB1]|uniref:hypothetical protein n=1 Tax=Janthinobacterium sp. GW458P TaxID=1981504 RepID=UPI000A323D95|nr:hypothetical protein [Janthinobacterium sp. GW458P]MBE3024982.1 hypothetical protein [Janthinobacterium sp. GW458P]PJC99606.1 hypothetical protein GQ37_004595 [Janthinobacterium sp. BJB1]
MKTHLLSNDEYQNTFHAPMLKVTETAREVVDLWAYADLVIGSDFGDAVDWNWQVVHIYESSDGKFQHIGIPVPHDETYLTVIVDIPGKKILGHVFLDLRTRPSSRSDE